MPAPRSSAVALVLLASACPDPADEARSCPLQRSEDCDVREAECHRHVHEAMICARGVEHPLPPIDVLTPEQYDEQYPPPPPRSDVEQRTFDQFTRAYKLLGFLPPDWIEPPPTGVSVPYIAYRLDSRRIVVVADRTDVVEELRGLLYVMALAHRDRESDITGQWLAEAGTTDGKLALAALYAGESEFFTYLLDARGRNLEMVAQEFSWEYALGKVRAYFEDPAADWRGAMSRFQHVFGADYMLGRYLEGRLEAITAAYDDAIASTAHVLAGPDVELDAAFSAIDTDLPAPPPYFYYIAQDSFGPALLHLHRLRRGVTFNTPEAEEELARAWIGDRVIFAATSNSDAVAVVWQIAGPGGQIAETILLASDDATLAAFQDQFPGA